MISQRERERLYNFFESEISGSESFWGDGGFSDWERSGEDWEGGAGVQGVGDLWFERWQKGNFREE